MKATKKKGTTPDKAAGAELKRNVANIKKFLKQRDYGAIDTGVELARSLDNPAVFEELLKDCAIDKEGQLVRNKMFSGTGPAQPYLNYALLNVIAHAPDDCELAVNLRKATVTLSMELSSTKPLGAFKNLKNLNLGGSSLQNIDALANLTNLASLNLSHGWSLYVNPTIGAMTTRKQVAEYQDKIRLAAALREGDTEVLSEYRNRTSLDLRYCVSLQNVDGLTNLTKLDLSGCAALSELPVKDSLTSRKQVAAYQERIKKAMKCFSS